MSALDSTTGVRGRVWRWAAAVALFPLLVMFSGCGVRDVAPYNCPWFPSPVGVAMADLAGEYTGTNPDGPASLTLTEDGQYAAQNVRGIDWLSGNVLWAKSEGTWTLDVGSKPFNIPFYDEPPPTVKVELGRGVELNVSGSLDELFLVDRNDPGETCDSLETLLRRSV